MDGNRDPTCSDARAAKTLLQAGVELLWLHDLVADEEEMVDLGITETGDINARTVAVRLSICLTTRVMC